MASVGAYAGGLHELRVFRDFGLDVIADRPAERHRNGDRPFTRRGVAVVGAGDVPRAAARERDALRELWDGARAGPEGAVRDYGADDAFPIGDIDEILPGLIERCSAVYHSVGLHPEFDQRIFSWVNGLRAQAKHGLHTPQEFVALDHPLHELRLVKSREELGLMRRAAAIAVAAHERAMRFAAPGRNEYEVAAELQPTDAINIQFTSK